MRYKLNKLIHFTWKMRSGDFKLRIQLYRGISQVFLYIEKRCKDTEQSRVGEVQVKPADTLHLEDEIRRLQAQNTALQRNISGIFIYREEV